MVAYGGSSLRKYFDGTVVTDTVASAADLIRMVLAFRVSRALHVVATLGVADLLAAGPSTSYELARRQVPSPGPLCRLLRAVASVGVLHEDEEGAFALTTLGDISGLTTPSRCTAWRSIRVTPRHGPPGRICSTA